jgi:hypothetical protein
VAADWYGGHHSNQEEWMRLLENMLMSVSAVMAAAIAILVFVVATGSLHATPEAQRALTALAIGSVTGFSLGYIIVLSSIVGCDA